LLGNDSSIFSARITYGEEAYKGPSKREKVRTGKAGEEGEEADTWRKGRKSKTHAGVDETLNLDVIDDDALTEAVLRRVVERLLRRK